VGFVSDLPTGLVAAFRATLEEVLEADLLLHVRDISHPDAEAQKRDVEQVLRNLFGSQRLPDNVVEVYNKIDLLSPEQREALDSKKVLKISAVTGDGIDSLLAFIEEEIARRFFTQASYTLKAGNGKALAWLHANGKVVAQETEGEYIHLTVQLSEDNIRRFKRLQHAD
jgi:GTPase